MTQGLAESYKFEHVPLALFFFFFCFWSITISSYVFWI